MSEKVGNQNSIQITAILKGLICSFVILVVGSIILGFLFSLINSMDDSLMNRILLLINYLAVFFGGIYAARKTDYKGWLHGGLVGFMYMLIILMLGTRYVEMNFNLEMILRILSGFLAGGIGGMIGVNIKY